MDGAAGAAGPELERAARLVLGRPLGAGVAGEELRRAFRRRALELHPDRAAALGRPEAELAARFRDLCRAYDLLGGRPVPAPAPPPARRAAPRPGGLPPRPLRFAEYLYYAGRIGWADLAEAIAWQRHAGRRIGQWFVERGLIAAGEVPAIRAALGRHNAGRGP